jgi:hypothetical protein
VAAVPIASQINLKEKRESYSVIKGGSLRERNGLTSLTLAQDNDIPWFPWVLLSFERSPL